MNVSLTPELEQYIQAQVDSGMYHSASEVIREGLRLLKRCNSSTLDIKAWYNAQIDIALKQMERGEGIPGEECMDQLFSEFPLSQDKAAS